MIFVAHENNEILKLSLRFLLFLNLENYFKVH